MAYARKGEHSDIYLYAPSPGLWICEACPFSAFGNSCTFSSYGNLSIHLAWHKAKGHKVPEQVFDRLLNEMEGLPWETDVERALKQVVGEAGQCLCRTPHCGHAASQHGANGVCTVCNVTCWS